MKLLSILITIIAGFLFTVNPAGAQQRSDSAQVKQPVLSAQQQRRQQFDYYKRSLNVDSAKAEQVSRIQDDYKTAMKALEGQNQDPETRRARIKALMDDKNRRLSALLTAEQQRRIIPPTEGHIYRSTGPDSTRVNP